LAQFSSLDSFGSAENVFHATRAELESLRLKPESIESILKREFHEKAEEELEKGSRNRRRCFDSWTTAVIRIFCCAKSPTRRLRFMSKAIGKRVSTRRASGCRFAQMFDLRRKRFGNAGARFGGERRLRRFRSGARN
jgi:hypothetical protein